MSGRYWRRRRKLTYYRNALEYAQKHCRRGKTLLDVGGGVGLGCRCLKWFPEFERTSVEKPTLGCTLPGVSVGDPAIDQSAVLDVARAPLQR